MLAAVIGDIANHDYVNFGVIAGSMQTFITINGIPVAIETSPVTEHAPCVLVEPHIITLASQTFVTINGLPINRMGDLASCGAVLMPNQAGQTMQKIVSIL